MSSEDESPGYARKACIPCRRSKRRCDRRLPGCHLCGRKEVECAYPARQTASANSAAPQYSPWSQGKDTHVTRKGNLDLGSAKPAPPPRLSRVTEHDANAVYFIAPHVFHQARLELPRQELPVPIEVATLLGGISSIRDISTTFFKTVHRWLPIVSKTSFFAYLLNPLTRRHTELSLLALCMKLCCTPPNAETSGASASLYRTAKHFHLEVEMAGTLSIHTLQAGALIALYELAHAIYPAAYLSVGACARQGQALGLDKLLTDGTAGNGNSRTNPWQEVEERRRAWWAVLMFDRFLNLSNPERPLSTEDPSFDAILPVDDAVWDDWSSTPSDNIRISTGFSLKIGSFARLAQTTYLLSQALRSISPAAAERDGVSQLDETSQLRRTLLALVSVADREATVRKLEYCAQSALSLSTILVLEENRLDECSGEDSPESSQPFLKSLWPESRTALERLQAAAASYSATCPTVPDAPHIVPIFLIHAMYQVVCFLLKKTRNSLEGETKDQIDTVKYFLGQISSRWRLAEVYLKVIEAQEIAISSTVIDTRMRVFLGQFEPSSPLT